MSPGAKVFLTLAGVGGVFAVIAIASSRKAGASPLPKPDDGTVVVPPTDNDAPTVTPPEGGFVRDSPFSVPGVQDAQEAARILLRWWSAEGQALVNGDTSSSKPSVPSDFGSQASDLSGQFTPRVRAAAAAFQHFSGMTPEDGVLTNPLLLALRRWAASQALPPEALPPLQSPQAPGPIVLPSVPVQPPQSGPPPFVPLPPIVPSSPPVVPVPPVIPDPGAPVPPVVLPPSSPAPSPPIVPLPPIVAPPVTPPVAVPTVPPATAVSKDTAAMVNALLTAESAPGWNTTDPSVKAWQSPRGMVTDAKFGPKSALLVAEEFGTIPIVRFWPKGSQKAAALLDYRTKLIELANKSTDPVRAKQLRVSAQREQGQSYGVVQGKAKALPEDLQVQLARVS